MKLDNLKYEVIHHTAVYRTSTPQFYGVNRYHKKKFRMKSQMGWWVTYNWFIDIDGTFTQTRLIGEETAAQSGLNCDVYETCTAVSGCFAMNGFKQVLNTKQREGYRNLKNGTLKLETVNGGFVTLPELKLKRKFHKEVQVGRTCAGMLMTHEYMDSVLNSVETKEDKIKAKKIQELQSQLDIIRKVLNKLLSIINKMYGK